MIKQEEQKIREVIDLLLPLQALKEYLKNLEKAHNVAVYDKLSRISHLDVDV